MPVDIAHKVTTWIKIIAGSSEFVYIERNDGILLYIMHGLPGDAYSTNHESGTVTHPGTKPDFVAYHRNLGGRER